MKYLIIFLVYIQIALFHGASTEKPLKNDFDAIFFENVNFKGT